MGGLKPVPVFGDSFATIFPLALIILVVLNAFNLYGKQN